MNKAASFTCLAVSLLLALYHAPLMADTLYKCIGSDGIPSYTTTQIDGGNCLEISKISAEQGRWRLLGFTNESAAVSLDTKTMERNKSGFTAWVQYVAQPGKKMDAGNGKWPNKLLHRYRIECGPMTMGTLSSVAYQENGSILDSSTWPAPLQTPIVPQSIGEMIWSAGCGSAGQ